MQLGRDDPVEKRQHDEVEHDRHDHFTRAKLRAQRARYGADTGTHQHGGQQAEWNRNQRRRADGQHHAQHRGAESTGGELSFGAHIEQPRATSQRKRETGASERGRLVEHLTDTVRVAPRALHQQTEHGARCFAKTQDEQVAHDRRDRQCHQWRQEATSQSDADARRQLRHRANLAGALHCPLLFARRRCWSGTHTAAPVM